MINLLPPDQKKELRAARSNTVLRGYLLLTFITLGTIGSIFTGALYFNMLNQVNYEQLLADNNKKLTDLSTVRARTEKFNKDIAEARKVFNAQISLSDAMAKIAESLPPGAVLTGISLDSQSTSKPLSLTAKVDSFAKAGVLEANFKASSFFKQITVVSVTGTAGGATDSKYPYTVNLTVLLDPSIVNPLTKETAKKAVAQ